MARYKKNENEMFDMLSEYEKEVVEEFAMLHQSPFTRLHDAIVTCTKAQVSIKGYLEGKWIKFGGEFDKTPRISLAPREKAEQLVRKFKGL
jgi:hypothetical protein